MNKLLEIAEIFKDCNESAMAMQKIKEILNYC